MKIKKSILRNIVLASLVMMNAGCVTGWRSDGAEKVSVGTVRRMAETLRKFKDGDEMCVMIVEAYGCGASFEQYVDAVDEMMLCDGVGFQEDAMLVLNLIRRPNSDAMARAKDKEIVREKTGRWLMAGLTHSRASVQEYAINILNILPRMEMEAIAQCAKGRGITFSQKNEKCRVCDKGKVTVKVDLGVCPACNGKVVRAERSKAIIVEKLCKMCEGNGNRSGQLTFVCEHCQGDWEQCSTLML